MKRFLLIYDSNYYKIAEEDYLLFYPNEIPLVVIEITDELISAIIGDKDE